MPHITLITGGGRSGKSSYALAIAGNTSGRRCFIATCPVIDKEMEKRIAKHRNERKSSGWETIEEHYNLANAISNASEYNVVLVDCLALWVNNLMYRAQQNDMEISEEEIFKKSCELIDASENLERIILVTNEVGLGIIPDNFASRLFRDLLGRCNQVIASRSDEVIFMAAGIPMRIK